MLSKCSSNDIANLVRGFYNLCRDLTALNNIVIVQALAETTPIYPRMFFRKVVDLALSRHQHQK
jgi:hypothetical protein